MTILLDTNYIVRYFVNDIKPLAQEAAKIIKSGKRIFISSLSIAESVYVLSKHYGNHKNSICEQLINLLKYPQIVTENYVILSMQIFQTEDISIYDSIILGEAIQKEFHLITFDKKLERVYKKYSQN